METALIEAVPITLPGFGEYFDFFGFILVFVVGGKIMLFFKFCFNQFQKLHVVTFLFDLRRYHLVDNAALAVCMAVIIFLVTTGGFNGRFEWRIFALVRWQSIVSLAAVATFILANAIYLSLQAIKTHVFRFWGKT